MAEAERFGAYEVVEHLSSGGMGVVFRAVDGPMEVAVKTTRAVDGHQLRALRAEIRALERVRHPGVVRILGHGVRDGVPWYAMELLRGTTLRAVLRGWFPTSEAQSTFPETPDPDTKPEPAPSAVVPAAMGHLAEVATWFRALAEVLAWLHGEGVVHRDLKPDNVFVRPDGTVVLVDFGLAHEVAGAGASRESLDALVAAAGTLDYMAPEQALGDVVDARADLYALGVMLYEAICGRPPFTGGRSHVLFAKIGDRAPPVDTFASGVPRPLVRLLEDLLHPNPAHRTAHARIVSGVLTALGAASPPTVVPPRPYVYRPAFQPPGDVVARVIQAADAGKGPRLHLRGGAGSGKTRALLEVAQALRHRGFQVTSCPCVPAAGSRVAPPLDPLRPLLRAMADQALAGRSTPVGDVMRVHGPHLARWESALLQIPSVRDGAEVPELRPDTERVRLFGALAACLAALSREGPLLLVVDDLQYGDELTLGFLASLQPGELDDVVIVTAGTDPTDRATLELPALRDDQVRAMIAAMCGSTDAPGVLVRAVSDRAAGNPFVVAELLREAVRVGLLDRDPAGSWALAGDDLSTLKVPHTVEAMVDHHLSAVPPWAQAALRWAVVVGNGSEEELLLHKADTEAVDALVRARVLSFDGRGRVAFPSPGLAEVVHGRLADAERRLLHADAARALPQRPGTRIRLARHLREAGAPEAFGASLAAGEEALSAVAFELAVAELQRAADRVPPNASAAVRTRLQVRLGRAWWGAGHAGNCHDALSLAVATAGRPRPTGSFGSLLRLVAESVIEVLRVFRPDRAAEPPADEATAQADLAEAHRYLAYLDILRNEPLGTLSSAVRASAHGRAGGRRGRRATDLATLGVIAGFAGLTWLSERWLQRAEDRLPRTDRADEGTLALARASLSLGRAQWAEVHRWLDRGELAAGAVGDLEQQAVMRQLRGTALLLAGRVDEAVAQCRGVIGTSRSQMPRAWARCVLVESLLAGGRGDLAASELRTLLTEVGPHTQDQATRANALTLRAVTLQDGGQLDEALASAREAEALMREGSGESFGVFVCHRHLPRVWACASEARPTDTSLRYEARRAVTASEAYARRFRFGRPMALSHRALLDALGEGADRARDGFTAARAAAEEMQMAEIGLESDALALRLRPAPERRLLAEALTTRARALGAAGTVRRSLPAEVA